MPWYIHVQTNNEKSLNGFKWCILYTMVYQCIYLQPLTGEFVLCHVSLAPKESPPLFYHWVHAQGACEHM